MSFPGNRGIYNSGGGITKCNYSAYSLMNPHSPYHHPAPLKAQAISDKKNLDILEQHAQAQLHKLLPNEKVVVVARAGKLLFYAVALPPYLLLYGIPKWIAADLFALLAFQMKKHWGKGQDFLQNILKTISERSEGFVDLKNKLVSGTEAIVEYLKSISKISADLFSALKHNVISQTYNLLEALSWAQELKQGVEKFIDYAKNLSSETFRFTKDQLQDLKATLQNIIRPGFEQLLNRLEQIKKEVNKAFDIASDVKKQAQAHLDHALGQTKEILNAIQIFVSQTAEPYQKWVSEKWETAQEVFKKQKEKVTKIVNRGIEETQQIIQASVQTITQMAVPVINQLIIAPQQMINLLATPFQGQFKISIVIELAQLKLRNWQESFKRFYQGFFYKGSQAKKMLQQTIEKVQKQLLDWRVRVYEWIKLKRAWLWEIVKSLPAKVWGGFVRGCKKSAHFFKLTWAWTKVLTRYGLELMRETSRELMLWLDSRPFYPKF